MNNRNNRFVIYLPIAFSLVLIIGIILGSFLVNDNTVSRNLLPIGRGNINKVDNIIDGYLPRKA